MNDVDASLLARIWSDLGGPPGVTGAVTFSGTPRALPSVYDVGALATATVAAATASVAALHAVRQGEAVRPVQVDRGHAAVAFRSERYLSAEGWKLPDIWDPIAGDYLARDGWIRLHTNYRHHRDAVLRALGVAESRAAVAAAVASSGAEELEAAVVAEGGCAARMLTVAEWAAHPQGLAIACEPLFATTTWPGAKLTVGEAERPLDGIRVLDLTRVLAGPVCTRVLAAYGAEVLRVDPTGFEEVPALLPDMTAGKRRAFLDLQQPRDRVTLERLIAGAHVMVHGYRSDALERLGFGAARRRLLNPSLVEVSHDAYGFSGPWAARRGFDSLVQMSAGIAERGRVAVGGDRPHPLPAQALDHGTGYLLAAAVCRGLARAIAEGQASDTRLSLARTAKLLVDGGDDGDIAAPDVSSAEVERWLEPAGTAFGPVRRVRCPVRLEGIGPRWAIEAGPLGVDAPSWA
jgi:hypothetical protein